MSTARQQKRTKQSSFAVLVLAPIISAFCKKGTANHLFFQRLFQICIELTTLRMCLWWKHCDRSTKQTQTDFLSEVANNGNNKIEMAESRERIRGVSRDGREVFTSPRIVLRRLMLLSEGRLSFVTFSSEIYWIEFRWTQVGNFGKQPVSLAAWGHLSCVRWLLSCHWIYWLKLYPTAPIF